MAQRTSEMGSRSRLSRLIKLEPITGAEEEIAKTHEINRQSAVKEILVHVFFMSKYGLIDQKITVGEAKSQYFSSTGGHQAAHCAPGQLLHMTRKVQDYVDADDDLLVTVDNLFGRTDGIDSKFNIADSRAEENGLRDALCSAAVHVASSAKRVRFNRAEEIHPHLANSVGVYKSFGSQAFRVAAARQRALITRRDPVDMAKRETTIAILNTYQECLATSMETVETVQGLFLEEIWEQYREL